MAHGRLERLNFGWLSFPLTDITCLHVKLCAVVYDVQQLFHHGFVTSCLHIFVVLEIVTMRVRTLMKLKPGPAHHLFTDLALAHADLCTLPLVCGARKGHAVTFPCVVSIVGCVVCERVV